MEKSRDTKSNFPAIRALIFCVWFALHFKIVFYCFVTNALSAYKTKIYATCRSVISTTFRNLVGESYFMYQTPISVATFLGLQVYERVSLRWKGGAGGGGCEEGVRILRSWLRMPK